MTRYNYQYSRRCTVFCFVTDGEFQGQGRFYHVVNPYGNAGELQIHRCGGLAGLINEHFESNLTPYGQAQSFFNSLLERI